ncbi:hypothetical protein SSTU70S_00331 [Stutzerimonas stutzeri]
MKGLLPANHPSETPYTKTGVQAYSYNYTMLPTRDRGTAIAAHEPYNFATHRAPHGPTTQAPAVFGNRQAMAMTSQWPAATAR